MKGHCLALAGIFTGASVALVINEFNSSTIQSYVFDGICHASSNAMVVADEMAHRTSSLSEIHLKLKDKGFMPLISGSSVRQEGPIIDSASGKNKIVIHPGTPLEMIFSRPD